MSGGVDSSVSALLLKRQGYEVIGTTLELFAGKNSCHTNPDLDAKKVCLQIGIPHFTYDGKKEFKNYVINDFIDCYANCKTPNPCIECNKYMKFGFLWEKAKELGCDYIATGHYAKTEFNPKYQKWVLKKSKNAPKDQSYVLWNMPKELIQHVLFPLADFETKDDIRKIAKENHLEVASKPDSEDICFVPDGDYKKFLEEHSSLKPKPGNIVNKQGEILGNHKGLYYYTIGQRKGLGISNSVPLFVLGFDKIKNEVIVGEEKELYQKEIWVTDVNLLLVDTVPEEMEVHVKTRYSTKMAKAKIRQKDHQIQVIFEEPQRAITPGQSAVFYVGDCVLRRRKNCKITRRKMKKGIIVVAFAGTGKTSCAKKYNNIYDLDHLLYKYSYPKEVIKNKTFEELKGLTQIREQRRNWLENYFAKLSECLEKYDIVFMPSNGEIMDYLEQTNQSYFLCYPTIESKEIYIKRYQERGTHSKWIHKMDQNFEENIKSLQKRNAQKIVLRGKETLEEKLQELKIIT